MANTTEIQDCNLIIEAFEHGAFFHQSEGSVFGPLSRNIHNIRSFSRTTQKALKSYDLPSKLPLKDQQSGKPDAASMQGIKFKNIYVAFPTKESGSAMQRAIKDCIPCLDRQIRLFGAFSVSASNHDYLKMLKDLAKQKLDLLNQISDLLSNVDIYGDFCHMIKFLDFMCVPDLQRMLAILVAQLGDIGIQLRSLNDLVIKLILPFFGPILQSIQTLLDQFTQLVLNFMNCIITSIDENLRKININSIFLTGKPSTKSKALSKEIHQDASQLKTGVNAFRSGLLMLRNELDSGQILLANKINFYTKQAGKLFRQWHIKDQSHVAHAQKKLINIRLIGLIAGMIKVKSKGSKLCENYEKPAASEINNFYHNYISPTSPFSISLGTAGDLHIGEKSEGDPTGGIVNQGKNLLTPLFKPVNTTFKCRIHTSDEDVDRVNKWITQLDGNI